MSMVRCHRCRTLYDSSKKACPNCGTLIRKKRGSFKLSPQSGVEVNPVVDFINERTHQFRTWMRHDTRAGVILAVSAIAVILAIVLLSVSCSSGCFSCASCAEGTNVDQSGILSTTDYAHVLNSSRAARQYATAEGIYYITEGKIIFRSSDGNLRTVYTAAEDEELAMLQAYGDYVYFSDGVSIYRVGTEVSAALPGSEPVLPAPEQLLDGQTIALEEYFLAENMLYYVTLDGEDVRTLWLLDNGLSQKIVSGQISRISYYEGALYYCMLSSEDSETYLYTCDMSGGNSRIVIEGQPLHEYEIGAGSVYFTALRQSENGTVQQMLCRYSLFEEKIVKMLAVNSVVSYRISDDWVCFVTRTESGDTVKRVGLDLSSPTIIITSQHTTQLTGISDDWFGLYDKVEMQQTDPTAVDYYLVNSITGEVVVLKD